MSKYYTVYGFCNKGGQWGYGRTEITIKGSLTFEKIVNLNEEIKENGKYDNTIIMNLIKLDD